MAKNPNLRYFRTSDGILIAFKRLITMAITPNRLPGRVEILMTTTGEKLKVSVTPTDAELLLAAFELWLAAR